MTAASGRERLLRYAEEKYGSQPEYLWRKYPDYAVLRNQETKKWYGAVMAVPAEKLGLSGTEKAEIVDLKCGSAMLGSLLGRNGFLPAYHMNKSNWITVLLDGQVPWDEIFSLLDLSYNLTSPQRG